MSPTLRTGMLAALALMSGALSACGPTLVNFDPSNAVAVQVRPASGQMQFCPGDAFQVELVAKLQSGSSCSNVDRARGCQGEKDAVISPAMVRIEAIPGMQTGDPEKFTWLPSRDILATADTGLLLRGWLEKRVENQVQKSMVAEAELKPVYQCHMGGSYSMPPAGYGGDPGARGPEVRIAITTLSTPFYPSAALLRVESGGSSTYYISPSAELPIHLVTNGQDGGRGEAGQAGVAGEDGRSASTAPACTKGETGRDGSDGGPGGQGGDGGPGGAIYITVDKAAADSLRARVLPLSLGGAGGPGGDGGAGGPGGDGGAGGPTAPSCSDTKGSDGRPGRTGPSGPAGRAGPNGPSPVFAVAAREALFAEELDIIRRIEAAKAKPSR